MRIIRRNAQSLQWALAYLRTQAEGFTQGTVTWLSFQDALDEAIDCGAPTNDILQAIRDGGKDATEVPRSIELIPVSPSTLRASL